MVSFHFGLPAPDLVDRLKRRGTKILSSATSVTEAKWLQSRGCDAIIAQGIEAGGHRGMFLETDIATQLGLFALLPQVVDAVSVAGYRRRGHCRCTGRCCRVHAGRVGCSVGNRLSCSARRPTYLRCIRRLSSSPRISKRP